MNLRERLTQNKLVGTTAAGALILIGITIIVLQMRSNSSAPAAAPAQAFFSIDDGKTWFADDSSKLPPFEKDGKQAMLAHVYRCADGTEFVNYLERFKPQAKQALDNLNNPPDPNRKGPPSNLAAVQNAYTGGREVKRPGDVKWTDAGNFREAAQIMAVKCPKGGADAAAIDP